MSAGEGSAQSESRQRAPAREPGNLVGEILASLVVVGILLYGLVLLAIPVLFTLWVGIESIRGLMWLGGLLWNL